MTSDELAEFTDTIVKQAVRHGMSEVAGYLNQDKADDVEQAMTSAVKRAIALYAAAEVTPAP